MASSPATRHWLDCLGDEAVTNIKCDPSMESTIVSLEADQKIESPDGSTTNMTSILVNQQEVITSSDPIAMLTHSEPIMMQASIDPGQEQVTGMLITSHTVEEQMSSDHLEMLITAEDGEEQAAIDSTMVIVSAEPREELATSEPAGVPTITDPMEDQVSVEPVVLASVSPREELAFAEPMMLAEAEFTENQVSPDPVQVVYDVQTSAHPVQAVHDVQTSADPFGELASNESVQIVSSTGASTVLIGSESTRELNHKNPGMELESTEPKEELPSSGTSIMNIKLLPAQESNTDPFEHFCSIPLEIGKESTPLFSSDSEDDDAGEFVLPSLSPRQETSSAYTKAPNIISKTVVSSTNVASNATAIGNTNVASNATAIDNTSVASSTNVASNATAIGKTNVASSTNFASNATAIDNTNLASSTNVASNATAIGNTNIASSTSVASNAIAIGNTNVASNATAIDNTSVASNATVVSSTTDSETQSSSYISSPAGMETLIKLEHPYAQRNPDSQVSSPGRKRHSVSYYCPHKECEQFFINMEQMRMHIRLEHDGKFSAPERAAQTPSKLPKMAKSLGSTKVLCCSENGCDVTCSSAEELAAHVKSHESGQIHKCSIHNCKESFETLAELREHIYSHRDKRVFTCRICEQSYQFSYQLRQHMQMHEDDDDDEQDLVQVARSVQNQPDLAGLPDSEDDVTAEETIMDAEHSYNKPVGSSVNNQYCCPDKDCSERFSSVSLLKIHSRSHAINASHLCTMCGLGFRFHYLLNNHVKVYHSKTARPRGRPKKQHPEIVKKDSHIAKTVSKKDMEQVTGNEENKLKHSLVRSGLQSDSENPDSDADEMKDNKSASKLKENQQTKGQRGRPRKVETTVAIHKKTKIENQEQVIKKAGRGRPKLEIQEKEIRKVGRGRPRLEVQEKAVEKVGRGRPKLETQEKSGGKVGRGRPKLKIQEKNTRKIGRGRPPILDIRARDRKIGRGRPKMKSTLKLLRKPVLTRPGAVERAGSDRRKVLNVVDSVSPTRCSGRSTKGQWKSAGSKTNMGGLGYLTAIRQERKKSALPGKSDDNEAPDVSAVNPSMKSQDMRTNRVATKRAASPDDQETPRKMTRIFDRGTHSPNKLRISDVEVNQTQSKLIQGKVNLAKTTKSSTQTIAAKLCNKAGSRINLSSTNQGVPVKRRGRPPSKNNAKLLTSEITKATAVDDSNAKAQITLSDPGETLEQNPSAAKSPTLKTQAAKPPVAKSPAAKPSIVKSPAVKPAVVKPAADNLPAVASLAVKQTVVKISGAKQLVGKLPVVKSQTVKPAKPSVVKATAVRLAAVKLPAEKFTALKSPVVKPAGVKTPIVKQAAARLPNASPGLPKTPTSRPGGVTKWARGLNCVVPYCLSYQFNRDHSKTDVHFIKFPDQQADIDKWIKILKLPQDFEVKTSTRICHLHFKSTDFEIHSSGAWHRLAGTTPRIFNVK